MTSVTISTTGELLAVLRELGIGLTAWGPLGSGFLAGSADSIGGEGEDFRANAPRFQPDNLAANRDRFAPLRGLAAELELTPAQLALAWLLHQGDDVVPIPGTRTPSHLDENLAAADVALDEATLGRIDEIAPAGAAAGEAAVEGRGRPEGRGAGAPPELRGRGRRRRRGHGYGVHEPPQLRPTCYASRSPAAARGASGSSAWA